MAKRFSSSLKIPYKGVISSVPIQYCGGAKALPLYFPWRQYGTYLGTGRQTAINPGVQFSTFVPPAQILDKVQGVFIDNTDCSSPVYLQCDEGHMVACADNATAYFPLMTNNTNFTLYIETIDGPYQADQQTNIFLLDKAVPPFLQGQASAQFVSLAQVSGVAAFSTNFLADRFISTQVDNQMDGQTINMVPAEPNRTFIVKSMATTANRVGVQSSVTTSVFVDFLINNVVVYTGGVTVAWAASQATCVVSPPGRNSTPDLALRVPENQALDIRVRRIGGNTLTVGLGVEVAGTRVINPTS